MKMANFLMPKNTSVAEVNHETHLNPDVTRLGAVAVRRGPIGDIAATDDGTLVVTNPGDDTVSLLDADTLAVAGVVAVPGEPFAVAVSGRPCLRQHLVVELRCGRGDRYGHSDRRRHLFVGFQRDSARGQPGR